VSAVIARTYAGRDCLELIALPRSQYIVAVNEGIPDGRRKLTLADAQSWYDAAAYRTGERPKDPAAVALGKLAAGKPKGYSAVELALRRERMNKLNAARRNGRKGGRPKKTEKGKI
jgi:hypothetical protein